MNGQTATITIVDGSNVVKDSYTATVTGGTWSVNVTAAQAQALADGSYSIKANVTDAAGNAAVTATQAITVDETVPSIAISPVDGNNIINKSEAAAGVTISGSATAGSGSAAVNGQTATITIVDGSNVVKDSYTRDGDRRDLVGERDGGAGPGAGRRQLQHQGQRHRCGRQRRGDGEPGDHGGRDRPDDRDQPG